MNQPSGLIEPNRDFVKKCGMSNCLTGLKSSADPKIE
jgi:hypothetical protein